MALTPIRRGRYLARLADGPADMARVQALRWAAFLGGRGLTDPSGGGSRLDQDRFDARCLHLLVEDATSGPDAPPLATFRLMLMQDARQAAQSYSAQFYGLAPMAALDGPVAELGRFCARPGLSDPDVLRLAWGALARLVADARAGWLFGCSSLPGADPVMHRAALSALGQGHMGPPHLRPLRAAPETVDLGAGEGAASMAGVPPLLRSYLSLGGWVSDHAVIDRRLDTMHVFTALDVAAIPPARRRLLLGVSS